MIHTVKQGEHLTRIAAQYGFRDMKIIWDDPNNADLRAKRDNPNVLFPGDQLFIPDINLKLEAGPTGKIHPFIVALPTLKLAIVLRDVNGDPIPNEECLLAIDGKPQKLVTDANGRIQQQIPIFSTQGEIRIRGQEYFLTIGDLDPVEEETGQRARLANLGYYLSDSPDLDDDEMTSAIEEFQKDNDLDVDGKCGKNTQAKLKKVHGC